FFKQKTAYEISRDWSSDMCSSDLFHPENSHVVPALLKRFHQATQHGDDEVVIWGSGKPQREFLHVDDMAAASVHVMELDDAVYQIGRASCRVRVWVRRGAVARTRR